MNTFTKGTLAALGALALVGLGAVPAAAQFGGPPPPPNTGIPLYAKLEGGQGAGNITVVVDPPKGTACYLMNVTGLENVTAAHIHVGGPGENGRPVVNLEAPTEGSAGGCTPVTADVAQALLGNPGGYYVNVHTRAFPNGAIRGQLQNDLPAAVAPPAPASAGGRGERG